MATEIQVKRKRGRPKGSRTRANVLREVLTQQSETIIIKNLPEIIEEVVRQAKKGNLSAAKLLLDRVIPPKRAVEFREGSGKSEINIHIEGLTAKIPNTVEVQEFEVVKDDQEERK